jgi:archaellum component FlaG (FlaF/FlaG flagellin family)
MPDAKPAAAPAAADAPTTVDAAAAERARKLLTEGARLHDEGKFSEAYVALVAAWAIKQNPSLAKNLADCEVAIGKHRDAAEHLRYIVKSPDAKPDEQRRAQAELDDTLKKIGNLRLSVSIDNAEVLLDGVSLGKSPFKETVFVTAGKHTFEARRDRYDPDKQEIEIPPGASQMVRLTLTVARTAADAPSSFDAARPWVIRGGVFLTVAGVALGAGMLALANKESTSATGTRLEIARPPGQPACPGSAGTSTATLCGALKSDGSQQSAFANASVGMFVVGGAAALATAGLWTYTLMTKDQGPFQPLIGKAGSSHRIRVAPLVGQREGGAMMVGQW